MTKERETKHKRKHRETKVHTNDTHQGMLNFLIWKVVQVAMLQHAHTHLHFQHKKSHKRLYHSDR